MMRSAVHAASFIYVMGEAKSFRMGSLGGRSRQGKGGSECISVFVVTAEFVASNFCSRTRRTIFICGFNQRQ